MSSRMRSRPAWLLALLFSSFSAVAACGSSDEAPPAASPTTDDAAILREYVTVAKGSYGEALAKTRDLKTAVDAFVADPTADRLEAAKAAWLAARGPYGRTEVYRYFGGPIDDEQTGPEGRVNGWPLDEAYIDYVVDQPTAGIINHLTEYPSITKELLEELNEKDGEANLSTGYHAIEFLLWGQDLSETGPGSRPFTDYVSAPNADRRRTYLQTVTALLVDDLTGVAAGWDDADPASFASSFVKLPQKEALTKAFKGIVMLSGVEIARERMDNAYKKGEQEEEHSCFSDNTTADLSANVRGIENVYVESRIHELVRAKDAALDDRVKEKLATAIAAIEAIPAPFDRAIVDLDKRPRVGAAIDATKALTDALIEAANALDVHVDIVE